MRARSAGAPGSSPPTRSRPASANTSRPPSSPCPSLADKKITPHVLRHTRAMRMRAAGHDISMIALWLGHEDISSTQKYLHADLMTKERALDRATADGTPPGRYQPTDAMLDFLDKLTGSS